MSARDTKYLAEFRESVKTWTDQRLVRQEDLYAMAMFTLYLVNLSDEDGWQYDGHSHKVALPLGCLVVKATMEGIPVVVFTSGRTAIACIRIFIRKLEQGLLEWVPDKFRT